MEDRRWKMCCQPTFIIDPPSVILHLPSALMNSVRINDLSNHTGKSVTVRGWVTHLRSSGKVAFIVMRDGTGILQTVLVKNAVAPETWEHFAKLTQETCLSVTGEVRPDARAPGGFELGIADLSIIGESPLDYP